MFSNCLIFAQKRDYTDYLLCCKGIEKALFSCTMRTEKHLLRPEKMCWLIYLCASE